MSRNNVLRILLALSALLLVLTACQATPPANTGGAEEPAEAPEAEQPDGQRRRGGPLHRVP